MDRSDYFAIPTSPAPPTEATCSNVVARMIDGLGYRLHLSMDGLEEEHCTVNPVPDGKGKTIGDVIRHVWGLVNWIHMHIFGQQMERPQGFVEQGWAALAELESLRKHFAEISDEQLQQYKLEDLPWWMFVNMPLADALHHEGEIRLLRMQLGIPAE